MDKYSFIFSLQGVIKMYGAHLKASAAMVRLRLYDVLALLPTQSFESKYWLGPAGEILSSVTLR